ncbi:hypothetical protein VNO78_23428 [Psophocarpus tetragonolobus]|uniref:Uncharacterized protein n=1 Tax=Psophocarpus tetragonolobus TaxID=3891 RepID=A0AAN9XE03_PSOTE
MFFKEETHGSCSIIDLYELVQHTGNTLPRLYFLCTVASVYIKSKEAPVNDVLKDLVEMCRGIQHPVHGLFLLSELSQVSRYKFLDIGSEYIGDVDTVADAVEFVLQNFTHHEVFHLQRSHDDAAEIETYTDSSIAVALRRPLVPRSRRFVTSSATVFVLCSLL